MNFIPEIAGQPFVGPFAGEGDFVAVLMNGAGQHQEGRARGVDDRGLGGADELRVGSEDFGGAHLRGLRADSAAFNGCDFSEAELLQDDFNRCQFQRCRFAGLITEVCFRAESWHADEVTRRVSPPDPDCVTDCDFTQARLRSVSFEHLNLREVRFPDDDEHLALPDLRCVLLQLRQQLAHDDSRVARQLSIRVDQQLSALPRSRSHGYLSLPDLTESASHIEAHTVTRWVREAAEACARAEKGWLSRLRGGG